MDNKFENKENIFTGNQIQKNKNLNNFNDFLKESLSEKLKSLSFTNSVEELNNILKTPKFKENFETENEKMIVSGFENFEIQKDSNKFKKIKKKEFLEDLENEKNKINKNNFFSKNKQHKNFQIRKNEHSEGLTFGARDQKNFKSFKDNKIRRTIEIWDKLAN